MAVPHDTPPPDLHQCATFTQAHTPGPFCTAPKPRRISWLETGAIITGSLIGAGICAVALAHGVAHQLLPIAGLIGFAGITYLTVDTLLRLRASHARNYLPHAPECDCIGCEVERHVDAWAVQLKRQDEAGA